MKEVTAEQQRKDLIESSQVILDAGKAGESSELEVCSSFSDEMKVVFEGDDYSLSTHHESRQFGVRCLYKGQLGFVTTNSSQPEQLKKIANEVQNIARLSPTNQYLCFAEPVGDNKKEHEMIDSKLDHAAPKEILDWMEVLIDGIRSDERISLDRAELSLSKMSTAILNTQGVQKSLSQVTVSWSMMGMGKTKDEVTSFDYTGSNVSEFALLHQKIKESAHEFQTGLIKSLGPKPAKSYQGTVLLHPDAVMDLIAECIVANCNGSRHQDGMSSWKGKEGQQVANSILTVSEDPQNKKRTAGWMPFDREGVQTQGHDLVKEGRLNFIAHHCLSAKKQNVQPTGNALGGPRTMPSIGFSNLVVQPSNSKMSVTEMQKSMKQGLVVKRFSGNSDPVSGNFSGVAKNSWWIENGEFAFPVQEVMIAGNLFDLLKQTQVLGSELFEVMGSSLAPYALVDGVTVTASK